MNDFEVHSVGTEKLIEDLYTKLETALWTLEKIAGPEATYLNDSGNYHRCRDLAADALVELTKDEERNAG